MKSAILAAILKTNGTSFKKVLYTIEVGLSRGFQQYITRPDIQALSEVKDGEAFEAPYPL